MKPENRMLVHRIASFLWTLVLVVCIAIVTQLTACSESNGPGKSSGEQNDGNGSLVAKPGFGDKLSLGPYLITVMENSVRVTMGNRDKAVLESVPGKSLFVAQRTELTVSEAGGIFDIQKSTGEVCDNTIFTDLTNDGGELVITGEFTDPGCVFKFSLKFYTDRNDHLRFEAATSDVTFNHLKLVFAADTSEHYYGFGQQLSLLDFRGQIVPILVQEQGIGRNRNLIADVAQQIEAGATGDLFTTSFSVPQFVSSANRAIYLAGADYTEFNFSVTSEIQIEVFSNTLSGGLVAGATLLETIQSYTDYCGKMPILPSWLNSGVILGMQGGSEQVLDRLTELQRYEVPVSAIYLPDWSGKRTVLDNSTLSWWNWELDRDLYSDWDSFTNRLRIDNIRLLAYLNPYLTDPADKLNLRRNLYQEALVNDFFVKDANAEVFTLTEKDFTAGIIDLSLPEARIWFQEIIRSEVLAQGFNGWMADFGEALPVVSEQTNASRNFADHNLFPLLWASVNQQVLKESGNTDGLYFLRAGYTQSPALSPLFFTGNQTVLWDRFDGLQSALIGLINGGYSGISVNHSEVGGFTSYKVPFSALDSFTSAQIPAEFVELNCIEEDSDTGECLVSERIAVFHRQPEVLSRWIEISAFSPLFRTSEGLTPEINAQVYPRFNASDGTWDDNLTKHFSIYANVYALLAEYRRKLLVEASTRGTPVVRHPLIQYPDDENFLLMQPESLQFMLGPGFMVAPFVSDAATVPERTIYLPQGRWVELWGPESDGPDEVIQGPANLTRPAADAQGNLNPPPVFYLASDIEAVNAALAIRLRIKQLREEFAK